MIGLALLYTNAMLLSPPGGLRAPRQTRDSTFPSAKMLLPLISRNLAELSGLSDAGGVSPLKMSFPDSSANFLSGIFLEVFTTCSELLSLLGPPFGYMFKRKN